MRDTTTSTSTTTTSTTTTSSTTTSTTTTTTSSTTTTTLRFEDNGDGTVTDHQTGLIWEKKTGTAGTRVVCTTSTVCPDPHDVNNTHQWSSSGTAPDGSAFTLFLNTLNGGATGVGNCATFAGTTQTGGFNDHCDWRLPTIAELRTIVDTSASGCGTATCGMDGMQPCPCIDPTFGATTAFTGLFYWSSTTATAVSNGVWGVGFDNGSAFVSEKDGIGFVRAVRGGS